VTVSVYGCIAGTPRLLKVNERRHLKISSLLQYARAPDVMSLLLTFVELLFRN
jgi:hypothetical protein